ncbi:MAG TPA: glycosyltransferase family 4 protein [Candidatus Megaira endosymbiont of Nemacystus decipiens]|nr:glycosyltransferase family 4 protein [Candidatus Megaera endosymbiont of Nemacystus decipiens]
MKIFNLMMSRDLGGIQQAYVDFARSLFREKHDAINISSLASSINKSFTPNHRLLNLGNWCFISKIHLLVLFIYHRPNMVICHGNRSIIFATLLKFFGTKLLGVTHNYSYKHLKKCDHILALTSQLRSHLIKNGFQESRIHMFSNIIKLTKPYKQSFHFPMEKSKQVVVGGIGRLIETKGFSDLIQATAILKSRGFNISLLIGGRGKNKNSLLRQVKILRLQDEVEFCGWVYDKDVFFNKIDIFCLPSHKEAFGIVVLEAMSYSKPVIATMSGGPQEIIEHKKDGLLVPINSPEEIANNIEIICKEKGLANYLSCNAYTKLQERYEESVVSLRLSETIKTIEEYDL